MVGGAHPGHARGDRLMDTIKLHLDQLLEEVRLLRAQRLIRLRDSSAYKRLSRKIANKEKRIAYFHSLIKRHKQCEVAERVNQIIGA